MEANDVSIDTPFAKLSIMRRLRGYQCPLESIRNHAQSHIQKL